MSNYSNWYYIRVLESNAVRWIKRVQHKAQLDPIFTGKFFEDGDWYMDYDCMVETHRQVLELRKDSEICTSIKRHKVS